MQEMCKTGDDSPAGLARKAKRLFAAVAAKSLQCG